MQTVINAMYFYVGAVVGLVAGVIIMSLAIVGKEKK